MPLESPRRLVRCQAHRRKITINLGYARVEVGRAPGPSAAAGEGDWHAGGYDTLARDAPVVARPDGPGVRQLLREKGTPYAELDLGHPKWSDDELLDLIGKHPILLNRPIVVTPLGTSLCRPSEAVLALLPVGKLPPFTKEDGEVIEDPGVRRG